MFHVPDVNFFNGFNMILNDNVIDCFLEENNTKQIEKENVDCIHELIQDNAEKVCNDPIGNTTSLPQKKACEYKKITKKIEKIINKKNKNK